MYKTVFCAALFVAIGSSATMAASPKANPANETYIDDVYPETRGVGLSREELMAAIGKATVVKPIVVTPLDDKGAL